MHMVMQMEMIKNMLRSYRLIHPQTKRLLRFCVMYTTLIVLSSVCLAMLAGRGLDYYSAMQVSRDCFAAVRPCIGISAAGGLLIEGALHSGKVEHR